MKTFAIALGALILSVGSPAAAGGGWHGGGWHGGHGGGWHHGGMFVSLKGNLAVACGVNLDTPAQKFETGKVEQAGKPNDDVQAQSQQDVNADRAQRIVPVLTEDKRQQDCEQREDCGFHFIVLVG